MKSEELAAPGSHRKLRTIEMNPRWKNSGKRRSCHSLWCSMMCAPCTTSDLYSAPVMPSVWKPFISVESQPVRLIRRFTRPPLGLRTVSLGAISKPLNRPWNSFIKTVISYGAWNSVKEAQNSRTLIPTLNPSRREGSQISFLPSILMKIPPFGRDIGWVFPFGRDIGWVLSLATK